MKKLNRIAATTLGLGLLGGLILSVGCSSTPSPDGGATGGVGTGTGTYVTYALPASEIRPTGAQQ